MRPPQPESGRRTAWPWLPLGWRLINLAPLSVMLIVVVLALVDRSAFDRLTYYAGVNWGQLPFYDAFTPLSWFECAQRGVDIMVANPCDTRYNLKFPMSYPPAWLWFNFEGLGTAHTNLLGLVWGALFLASLAFLPPPNSAIGAATFLVAALSHVTFYALYQANFDVVIFAGLVLAVRLALRGGLWRYAAYAGLTFLAMLKIYPLIGLVLLLRERLQTMILIALVAMLVLALHVVDSLEGWRLSVAMIPSRDPIGMFGVRNLRLGLPVLWGTDGTGRSAVILTYLAFGGMFFAVAIWCARQITRKALLDHLSEMDITIALVFVTIMVFCFLAAQNFMYRAIFLIPMFQVVATLRARAVAGELRLFFGVVLIGMLACMWGGFGLQAIDHFQKAIYAVDRPPNNLIRAVAWTIREVAWWFVMAVLSALLVSIYCRMPVVMRLVRLLPGRFGSP